MQRKPEEGEEEPTTGSRLASYSGGNVLINGHTVVVVVVLPLLQDSSGCNGSGCGNSCAVGGGSALTS